MSLQWLQDIFSPVKDLEKVDEDLAKFLDIESAISHDDLIKQLPEDLEIPMLDDASLYSNLPLDEGSHLSDSSDSGLSECFPVKEEPLSPAFSHCSDHSNDSLPSHVPMDCTVAPSLPGSVVTTNGIHGNWGFTTHATTHAPPQQQQAAVIKCETPDTPPHTPPRDLSIIQPGSVPMATTTVTMPTRAQHVATSVAGGNTIKLVIPGSSAAVNLTQMIGGGAQVGGAKIGGGVAKGVGVSQVLNAKVKIQPKPSVSAQSKPATSSQPATATTTTTLPAGKPLVLTPAEFNKLTAQGVLKFNPPTSIDSKPTIAVNPPGLSVASRVNTPAPPPTPSYSNQDTDVAAKLLKRQQRMIKNRESACLSRKRKKEYMATLEQKLYDFTSENEKLRQENSLLKKRVECLTFENNKLKGSPATTSSIGPGTTKKGVTILLGVMLLVSLNLGPLTSILARGGPERSLPSPSSLHHTGRTLLSFNERDAQEDFNAPFEKNTRPRSREEYRPLTGQSSRELMLIKQMEELNIPQMASMCPTHFNTTESMRVLKELRGWVLGHEQSIQREQEKKGKPKVKPRKRYPAPRKMKAAMNGGLKQLHTDNNRPIGQYDLQVFTRQNQYNQFMEQIHRRNDTFYVVSFRSDHFLLPATAHNKTTRPRMSLVMPAMGVNETLTAPDGSISMMQIDCEVTSTKLVHIQKSAVPEHLMDNTTSSSSRQDTTYGHARQGAPQPWN